MILWTRCNDILTPVGGAMNIQTQNPIESKSYLAKMRSERPFLPGAKGLITIPLTKQYFCGTYGIFFVDLSNIWLISKILASIKCFIMSSEFAQLDTWLTP